VQPIDVADRDLDARPGEQFAGLGGREVEIGGADLGELARQPLPVQPQQRVAPRDRDDSQPRRGVGEQVLEALARLVAAQVVEVVEHEDDGARQALEAGEQAPHELVLAAGGGGERGERVVRGERAGAAQRIHDADPETGRVGLIALDLDPRHRGRRSSGAAQPGRDQHRLAAARRSGHERYGACDAAIEQREETRALDHARDQPRCARGAGLGSRLRCGTGRGLHREGGTLVPSHPTPRRLRRANPAVGIAGRSGRRSARGTGARRDRPVSNERCSGGVRARHR
jgi:hypothetical protein